MVKFAPYGDINNAIDIFWGLSTDPKPTTDIIAGSIFIETDTLTLSMWNGTSWQTNNAAQLVMPNGLNVKQDANGYLGLFDSSGVEQWYWDDVNKCIVFTLPMQRGINFSIGRDQYDPHVGISNGLSIYGGLVVTSNLIFFNGHATAGFGLGAIYNLDNRTGITTADASAITLYTTTAAGQLYRINARAFATAGTSATYVIKWTEGGVVNSKTLSVTAVDTEVTQNFLIQPDNGTAITAQITAISSTTLNVATSVEELA